MEDSIFIETLLRNVWLLLALPLLLFIPGWLVRRLLLPREDALESAYEAFVIGALLNGWLALVLASFGVFSLWLHLVLLALVCGGLLLAHRRWPPPSKATPRASKREALVLVALLIPALLGMLPFQTILGARDAGVYANTGFAIARTGSLVQHDPLLAALGEQAQSSDPALHGPAQHALSNFLGVQNPERFIATRLYTAGFFINEGELNQGRIVPQHLHLLSAWIGLLTAAMGYHAGLMAPGLMGMLGVFSVAMLGRRLAGGWVGALAALFLALNSVQVWFSRYTTAETTSQFLVFAGLYCFVRFQQQAQAAPAGRSTLAYAGLAGIAFGQLALNRIDAFLVLFPVMAYLGYCLLSRRWQAGHTALALALGAMLLHSGLHIIFIARAYFFDTAFARLQDYAITSYIAQPFITPLLREVYHTTNRSPFKDPWQLWRELAAIAAGLVVVWGVWRWSAPLRWFEGLLHRWRGGLCGLAALAILLVAGYAYFIRPQILTPDLLAQAPGCLLPGDPPRDPCLVLQGYIGAPVAVPEPPPGGDIRRMVPLANLVRVGWYLSPLGIVLGVAGFALWVWRGLSRDTWLFLLVAFLGTFFFVRDTYGTTDQTYIYILRRFVPIAYPAWSLVMAYALVWLAGVGNIGPPSAKPWLQRVRSGVAGGMALLLVVFFVWTGRPVYAHVEYEGALPTLHDTAEQFNADDVLLVRGGGPSFHQFRDVSDLVATPLRFGFGINALPIKSSNPGAYADALATQVEIWQEEGYTVLVMLSASGGDFALPGMHLVPTASRLDMRVPEYEQLTDQKPRNVATLALEFAIYRVEPGTPGVLATLDPPYAPDDFAAQVRGFYLPEYTPRLDQDGQQLPPASTAADLAAWTDGTALLRVPAEVGSTATQLTLHLAGGERPAHLGPAEVCVSWQAEPKPWSLLISPAEAATVPIGCVQLTEEMQPYTLVLTPPHLPPAPLGSVLLRLESVPWVPAEELPTVNDGRPLGVQFGGAYFR